MTDSENVQEKETRRPSVFTSRRQFIQLGVVTVGLAWVGTFVQSKFFWR
jgi:hypothetical protein